MKNTLILAVMLVVGCINVISAQANTTNVSILQQSDLIDVRGSVKPYFFDLNGGNHTIKVSGQITAPGNVNLILTESDSTNYSNLPGYRFGQHGELIFPNVSAGSYKVLVIGVTDYSGFSFQIDDIVEETSNDDNYIITRAELKAISVAYSLYGLAYSKKFLQHYLQRTVEPEGYPSKAFDIEPTLIAAVKDQHDTDLAKLAQSKVASGKWKEGGIYTLRLPNHGTTTPSARTRDGHFSDFALAIGGCTIKTKVTVKVSKKPMQVAPGSPKAYQYTIRVVQWTSKFTDVFTIQPTDVVHLFGLTIPLGNISEFEAAGHARRFNIKSDDWDGLGNKDVTRKIVFDDPNLPED